MMRNRAMVYASQYNVKGHTSEQRVKRVREKLTSLGINIIGEMICSPSGLNQWLEENKDSDPIIAVDFFQDIGRNEIAKMLVKHSSSAMVTSELNTNEVVSGDYIKEGPVLSHVLAQHHRLKSSVESVERNDQNPQNTKNTERQNQAREYGEKMWPLILEAAQSLEKPSLENIAKALDASGHKTINNATIAARNVRNYARASGNETKLDEMLFREMNYN